MDHAQVGGEIQQARRGLVTYRQNAAVRLDSLGFAVAVDAIDG